LGNLRDWIQGTAKYYLPPRKSMRRLIEEPENVNAKASILASYSVEGMHGYCDLTQPSNSISMNKLNG
jgi:hypothetical protein